MEKKNFLRAIFRLIIVFLIVCLVIYSYESHQKLKQFPLNEGQIHENIDGSGTVTVTDKWIVFKDDSFVKGTTTSMKFIDIYCELHKDGFVKSSLDTRMFNVSFSKTISVKQSTKKGCFERVYYLVDGYYIAAPTIKSTSTK